MAMVTMISMVMAMLTAMIAMTTSNDEDAAIRERLLRRDLFPQTFFAPNLNQLVPKFKITGPTSVFAFSRIASVAARLHRLSSGCLS